MIIFGLGIPAKHGQVGQAKPGFPHFADGIPAIPTHVDNLDTPSYADDTSPDPIYYDDHPSDSTYLDNTSPVHVYVDDDLVYEDYHLQPMLPVRPPPSLTHHLLSMTLKSLVTSQWV